MKWTSAWMILITLVFLASGCGGKTESSQDIAKLAYQWEKASFDNDYKKEQSLLYKKGSYEADKDKKKRASNLKYIDIRYEIYHDKKLDYYYVFTTFNNPYGENIVKDNLLFREKGGEWKLDQDKSININAESEINKLEKVDCIHCK